MATKIVTKNSSTAGAAPTATDLVQGELAVNVADGRLYTEDNAAAIVELGVNPATEITANAGIALPDSQKATFGAGDDLQIYHDGSDSYVKDAGVGYLNLLGTGRVVVGHPSNGDVYLNANYGGDVELFFSNSKKFETTSTGINVTGTATMDGLTTSLGIDVNGTDDLRVRFLNGGSFKGGAQVATTSGDMITGSAVDDLAIRSQSNMLFSTGGSTERMRIDSSGNVGIGTSSITNPAGYGRVLNVAGFAPAIVLSEDTGRDYTIGVNGNKLSIFDEATAVMTIDDAGNVGIGTSSPSTGLEVATTNYTFSGTTYDIYGLFGDTSGGIRLGTDSSNDDSVIGTTGTNDLQFVTYNGSSWGSRVTLSNTGNLGIGTSSPSELLTVAGNSQSGTPTVLISDTDTSVQLNQVVGKFAVSVSDGSSPGAGVKTSIQTIALNTLGSHYGMTFHTTNSAGNDTERMRIDASGNVLVGKSSTNYANVGAELKSDGKVYSTVSGGASLVLNRKTNDGDIISFYKDNAAVGSIGTNGGTLFISSPHGSDAGLRIGNGFVAPSNVSGAASNNTTDLGYSGNGFKNLFLSGGVYLGGTGAANKLDDYEEGTWTPAVVQGSVTTSSANYTKTGRTVVLSCVLSNFTNDTSTAAVTITGLPFASKSASAAVGSMLIRGTNRTGVLTITPFISSSSSQMTFYLSYENSTSYAPLQHDHFSSTTADIIANITYTT